MKIHHPLCLAAGGLCAAAAAVVTAVLLPSAEPASAEPALSQSLTDPTAWSAVQLAYLSVPVEGRTTLVGVRHEAEASAAAPSADYAIVAHRVHPARDALYEATNAAQGLRVAFAASGIRVVAEGMDAELSLGLRAIGHGERMQQVSDGALYARGERIDYYRTAASGAAVTEYFVNRPDGVEQSFLLESPVDARRNGAPLVIELACSGDFTPRMEPVGKAIRFVTPDSAHSLLYEGLYAFDARSRELPSWMELRDQGLALVVDDAGATYPVTVDPKVNGGNGVGKPIFADVGFRDLETDGILSDGKGDYVHGVDKVDAGFGNGFTLSMGTKGKGEKREAQFDFGLARLLPRGGGQYEGAHGDLPALADPDRMLSNSVQFNTWGRLAYERDGSGGWRRTDDLHPESMAIGEEAYMGLNVNLVTDQGGAVLWRLFFGSSPHGFGPFPPLDAEPVLVTRISETSWTLEALDLGAGVRASLLTCDPDGPYQLAVVDTYYLPFKMTFTMQ